MQKRRISHTNIEVSLLGLGTVKFGRNQGVKYPAEFELPSDKAIANLLGVASDLGITLLDTAPAYGSSEERLGKALLGKRQEWIVATKAGEEFIDGVSKYDFSAGAIRQSVERSLKRLRTDYLDIVLVHSNGDDLAIIENDDVFVTLSALKQEGKLRAYGMSTKTVQGGRQAIDRADIAMVTYNPSYTDEREVIQYAEQKQKGIFIKKAFGSGHLSPEAALTFILAEPGVTSIILGTINPDHLRENVKMACAGR